MKSRNGSLKIASIVLLGTGQSFIGEDKIEQDAKTDAILEHLGLHKESKILVRNGEEIQKINVYEADGFVIFPYCSERFSSLIYLAETRLPIIILSENETFYNALDTYEYLSDHENVQIAYGLGQIKKKIKLLKAAKWLEETKICLFDAGEWKLDGTAWLKNLIFSRRLNTQNINEEKFLEAYKNADKTQAESLARKWMDEAKVLEPSFEDVVKSVRVYIAMKKAMSDMKAKVAYVLWCGQFTKELEITIISALAKLADDGYLVGCWRGENLLPMLILRSVSGKPVFTCEAFARQGNIITIRHCFVPSKIADCRYVLRRWRNMEGTVTGYCQLPKGKVTLVNCGIGDKLVIAKGKVVDCKDLGGENCRMTVWIEMDEKDSILKFVGRELAVVYGDYAKEAKAIGNELGLEVL